MLLRHMLQMLPCFWVIQSLIIINLGWGGRWRTGGGIYYSKKWTYTMKNSNGVLKH